MRLLRTIFIFLLFMADSSAMQLPAGYSQKMTAVTIHSGQIQDPGESQDPENAQINTEKQQQSNRIHQHGLVNILFSLLILSMIFFILRLKKSHQQLLEKQDALVKANAAKDRFFSIIAHDLRNPFQNLTSFIRLMERHSEHYSPQEIKELTSELKECVHITADLLENLLEWSQSQTGSLIFQPYSFNLTPLIDHVLKQCYPMAQSKGILLGSTIEDPVILNADRNLLNAVLRNLVTNAIKYTHPDGEVLLSAVEVNGYIEVRVKDNGIGMETELRKKLFRIDQRVTLSGTADEKGTGLGLILCKEFVELHHGQIELESEPGKGTTFTIILPVGSR